MPSVEALPLPVNVTNWQPRRMGSLLGHADVSLGGSVVLLSCPVLIGKGGKPWVALPSRPVLGSDGKHRRETDGKGIYAPVGHFVSRAAQDAFSVEVVAALEAQFALNFQAESAA